LLIWSPEKNCLAGACEKKALVVDDDAAIRILVTKILSRHGFVVDAVPDGAAAIEHLMQHEYAVIVLDLMMPRIDGFGVIHYIEDRAPEMFSRVIVMTAFGQTMAEKICPPVVRFIHKPFDVERLLSEAASAAGCGGA
jgi:DNA-binding NtrC family response regulator